MGRKSAEYIKHNEAETKEQHAEVIRRGLVFDPKKYEYSDKFVPWDEKDPMGIHTVQELIEAMKMSRGKKPTMHVDIDARILCYQESKNRFLYRKFKSEQFLEACKSRRQFKKINLRESGMDYTNSGSSSSLVGTDFIPMLGGPFYKQLYLYDFMRTQGLSFWASNHDPVIKAIVDIKRNFTVGRGFRVDVKCKDEKRRLVAQAYWNAFDQVNNIQNQVRSVAELFPKMGEIMFWELPNNQSQIVIDPGPGQKIPHGMIPRFRLMDVSGCWDITTIPEDIDQKLFYTFIYPTQYNLYPGKDGEYSVPSAKFIYQQIPADQMLHFKVNTTPWEKRGRPDVFPALGYAKRLRDAVDYSIIAVQKAAAWYLDTTIEGDMTDLNKYIAQQKAIEDANGIAPAGSEFVHTKKVVRSFLANQHTTGGQTSEAFPWCLSMVCMATGIPFNFLASHLANAQTRAGSLVATEPVVKGFLYIQGIYTEIVQKMARRIFDRYGWYDCEVEVTFPSIYEENRSEKLKDMALAETQGWFKKKRCAEMASREFHVDEFDYEEEKLEIDKDQPSMPIPDPLTFKTAGPPAKPGIGITPDERADKGKEYVG